MELQNTAFENLCRDIQYRSVESKESGIYGIVAGRDFEAESLCIPGIWKEVSKQLNDDLLIAVPTKDIVLFTNASDKKQAGKMLGMAEKMFRQNQKETPYLLFSKDVFFWDRTKENLQISERYQY